MSQSERLRWSQAEVRSIWASLLRERRAERQAADRYCVMEATNGYQGHLGYRVVDLPEQACVSGLHRWPRPARQHADRLAARTTEQLLREWERER
jgi:hypothetical protein